MNTLQSFFEIYNNRDRRIEQETYRRIIVINMQLYLGFVLDMDEMRESAKNFIVTNKVEKNVR